MSFIMAKSTAKRMFDMEATCDGGEGLEQKIFQKLTKENAPSLLVLKVKVLSLIMSAAQEA